MLREIVMDTETTGLDAANGDRLIEVGCIEIVNRIPTGREFHRYLNPERDVHRDAVAVHGLTLEFLKDKPLFKDIAEEFLEFIEDAPLVAHNATFDIGFLNAELKRLSRPALRSDRVIDTLMLARRRHPAGPNSLDALCKRYGVDNSGRELHGALLDSEILADVYLAMTGGQTTLLLAGQGTESGDGDSSRPSEIRRLPASRPASRVIRASESELAEHEARLAIIAKAAGAPALWVQMQEAGQSAVS